MFISIVKLVLKDLLLGLLSILCVYIILKSGNAVETGRKM